MELKREKMAAAVAVANTARTVMEQVPGGLHMLFIMSSALFLS